jgi:hypothetical protein
MPANSLDCVFFIERTPGIELRDGMVHICYAIGRQAKFEVVLAPSTFLKALRNARQIADEFHEGSRNVVAIPRSGDESDEEVAASH